MKPNFLQTLLLHLSIIGVCGMAQAGQIVKVCDDEGGWPPYAFADPNHPTQVRGASIDIMTEVLKRAGYEFQLTLLPWKRCLSKVEDGSIDMLLHATQNEEREKKFLITKPYYSINSALFYLSSRYPQAPVIKTVADMKSYTYCGLFGYNYSMYNLPAAQLDDGAKDEDNRVKKLRIGRCDFILGDVEIINNFASMGKIDLKGIAHIPIPEAKPKEFHAMISRAIPHGEKLLKDIDTGLAKLKADKTYGKIMKNYGI
jgi:polar amino acid transport system substrate-binding protein